MKFTKTFAIFIMAIALLAVFSVQAMAKEQLLEAKITKMTVKPDKNGNIYARFIIQEDRELNGITYKAEVVTMAFGSVAEKAQTYKPGDTLKAIVKVGEYQGDKNYRIMAFIE